MALFGLEYACPSISITEGTKGKTFVLIGLLILILTFVIVRLGLADKMSVIQSLIVASLVAVILTYIYVHLVFCQVALEQVGYTGAVFFGLAIEILTVAVILICISAALFVRP